jgi:asparagine synthetase B (glutamine-hydrolysing)
MCGICGVRRFGETPIQRDMVDLLILSNANRGLEAAGVALQQADGAVSILKSDCTPYEFVSGAEYQAFMDENLKDDTLTVLGHTRKATKGTPRVNANNHPMFAGVTAVVHNGTITDDDHWFRELKLERKAETDSDVIRAILDRDGFTRKAVDTLGRLHGNAAIAAISTKHPGKLLLARSGNPIEMAGTKDYLIFSSERGPLYKAMRPWKTVWGIMMRDMTPIGHCMIGMNDNSAWMFGDHAQEGNGGWETNWLEWHQRMQIATNFQPVSYACHVQYHGNRVKFYDDKPVDVVECLNCGNYMSVSSAIKKDLKKYKCAVCHQSLAL